MDNDETIDFAQHNHRDDRIVVVATRPLTSDEPWECLAAGELRVFRRGRQLHALRSVHAHEPVVAEVAASA